MGTVEILGWGVECTTCIAAPLTPSSRCARMRLPARLMTQN